MKVSICILTYNRVKILKDLLHSLSSIQYSPYEIIVVDNNSTDNTKAMIKENFSYIKYFRTKKNIGVGARNIGLANATGECIITLDDDIVGLNDSNLKTLIDIFSSRPEIGAVCFKIRDMETDSISNWCHHLKKEDYCDREFFTDEITEGAVAFRDEAIKKAGMYPTFFFISYEGVDLLCRMLNHGYRTIYSPDIEVRHHTHPSGRQNWRRYYYDTRNQIWFVARNFPFLWGLKYLLRGLSAMLFYSLRDGYFIYWIKGLWHGLKKLPEIMNARSKLTDWAINELKEIGTKRPSILYIIRKRLFKNEIRL